MDDINSHVSLKIRSAIKAKLTELGTYVDNELPDYIMVLVVNKKTKEQMDNDLSLFLGHNTEHFTSWLSNVLDRLNSAAALTSSTTAPQITAPEKEIVKVKEEPVASVANTTTPASKVDNKAAETITKEKEGKDKKKSKEKKQEKKEKKKKKKEKKDLEKKLKKEAKEAKKKSLEAQELLNKENKSSLSTTEQSKVAAVPEAKRVSEVRVIQEAPVKRKRSSSHSSESDSNTPSTKRTIVEALGKNKTLTITKTIRNEHHKPAKPVNSSNANDDHSLGVEIPVDKSSSSTQKSAAKLPKKTAKIVISSDDEKEAVPPKVVEKHSSTDEEEEEEEEVGEEVPEEQSSECAAIDEPAEDIVDFKVGEAELEQELQDDEELEQEDEDERKELRARSSRKSSKASHQSSRSKQKALSVMDRLGPPRPTKRSRSSPEEMEDAATSDDPESRHSADELPSKAAKRRVVNLLEESSFPPRRSSSDKRPVSSKVVAPAAPNKKLEARVRPLSVVEKTSCAPDSSPSSWPAQSRRQHRDKSGDAPSSDTEESSGATALHSKVEVTGRERRPGASSSRRAPNSSALILRAVADAHRSVTSAKRTSAQLQDDQTHQKTSSKSSKKPKLEVFSRSYREREEGRLNSSSNSSTSPLKDAKIQKLSITVANPPRPSLRDGLTESTSDEEIRKPSALERLSRGSSKSTSVKRRLEVPERAPRSRYLVEDVVEDDSVRTRLQPRPSVVVAPQVLDANMEEVEEYIEEVEEWEEDVESVGRAPSVDPITAAAAPITDPLLLPLDQIVKQQNLQSEGKYSTRCMYWPACRLGVKCQYQHPSVPCKMFPNCQFGDKCLYIHPNCKFDALCTRPDCPFTHASPRPASQIPAKSKLTLNATVAAGRPAPAVTLKKCHYGLKCTNPMCPFLHPKPCKFGSSCLTPGCQFSHPDVSTGAKLKWVAPKLSAAVTKATTTVRKGPDSSTGHASLAEKALPDGSVKFSDVNKLVAGNGCAKSEPANQTKVKAPITAE